MATINTIKIRRSASTATPSTIAAGELAYSQSSKKLFYGQIAGSNAYEIIGGSLYTDMLDHTVGTLTASSALLVDANSKIDVLNVDNITLNLNTISTTNSNGDLVLDPNGSGAISLDAGTLDTSAQATEFTIIDNSATSLVIKEDSTAYMSFVTTNGSENILVGKPMEFDDTTQFDGNITVNGTTTYSGAINFANEDMTNVDINSGAIDGTTIGAASATTGAFTNLTASGTLGVTGVATFATHAVFGDSDIIKLGADTDLQIYHDGTNSYVANATGALKVATETSGIAVTIGHTTSETTIADNASITGDLGVSGATTVAAITASGTATLNGNVVLGNNAGSDTVTAANTTNHTGVYNIDNLRLDGNAITSTDNNGNISISPHGSGTVDVGTSRITSVTDPTGAQDAATKAYVDAVKSGFDPKDSVVVATTADDTGLTYSNGSSGVGATLTNDGNEVYAIDGVDLTADMRVLIKDQSPATENGIYYVSTAGAVGATLVLTRATDADTASELSSGAFVFVEQGSTNADAAFVMTQDTAITFGSTTVTWTQFSGAGQITAGTGISKTGNTINVGSSATITAASDTIGIKNISATAVGDILIGVANDGGYTHLAKAAANNSFLTMGTSGSASWTTTIDGGTF